MEKDNSASNDLRSIVESSPRADPHGAWSSGLKPLEEGERSL